MKRSSLLLIFLLLTIVVGLGLGLNVGGLGGARGGERSGDAPSRGKVEPPDRALLVFAASSLQDAFGRLADTFEGANPGVEVTLNLAGSQRLRAQIVQGAPADVFASADRRYVEALNREGLLERGRTFALNEPVVVVPTTNPASIQTLRDLPRARRIVLGAPDVPIGAYAERILQNAATRYGAPFLEQVEEHIVSQELNVRQVLAKVSLGEADAGIVYRSDAQGAKARVETIPIPPDLNVTAEYVTAVVKGTSVPDLARAWIHFVRSPAAQQVLATHGFVRDAPPSSREDDVTR